MISEYPNTKLLIAGDWCDGSGNRSMPVYNPCDGAGNRACFIGRTCRSGPRAGRFC